MTDKKSLEICLTPESVTHVDLKDKIAVIVDIFRATSSMVAGLSNGVQSVFPLNDVELALQKKKEGFVVAGERNGKKVDGFDIGNSPFEHMEQKSKNIAMTTTNGTKAIYAVRENAYQVIIAAFLNLEAVAQHLIQEQKDIVIVCAGWKGRFNAEDTLFAGALALRLEKDFDWKGDETLCASHAYNSAQDNLLEMLKHSSHYQRLSKQGDNRDMEFCLQLNYSNVVPVLKGEVIVLK